MPSNDFYSDLFCDKLEITWRDTTFRQVSLPQPYRSSSAQRGRYCVASLPRPFPALEDVPEYLETHYRAADPRMHPASLTRIDISLDIEENLGHLAFETDEKVTIFQERRQLTGFRIRKTDLTLLVYDKQVQSNLDHARWRLECQFTSDSFRRLFRSPLDVMKVNARHIEKLREQAALTLQSFTTLSTMTKLPKLARKEDEHSAKMVRALKRAVLAAQDPETIKQLLSELHPDHRWRFDFMPEENPPF